MTDFEDWNSWMLSRPDRQARKRRFLSELDDCEPKWMALQTKPQFPAWLNHRNSVTRKTRLELIARCSRENFDARTTAVFYSLFASSLAGAEAVKSQDECRVGQLLGNRYEVVQTLGAGGQGFVLLVYSHEVEEFFALKMFRPELASSASVRARFRKEANIWIDLGSHPNIVRARFVDLIDDRLCILADYVAPDRHGRVTLRNHVAHGQLQLEEIVRWSMHVCAAMTAAYERGLKAHRDLKPENVLIALDGIARVTDFGIASAFAGASDESRPSYSGAAKTQVGAALGTLPYMAPEQFADASQCNELSDLYSFGIILYEMISGGRWPYGDLGTQDGEDWVHLIIQFHAAHCNSMPRPFSHPLFEIAARCLEKRPEDRIQSFSAVRNELSRLGRRVGIEIKDELPTRNLDFCDKGRRATSLYRLGRYQDALTLYDEMLQLIGFDELTVFNKALACTALERIDEATNLYRRLLRQNPAHTGAMTNLATLLIRQANLADAEDLLLTVIAIDPDSFEARINLGNVCYRRGQLASAATQYESALQVEPSNPTCWYNLALVLLAQGKPEDAHASLLAFLDYADPEDSRIAWVKNQLDALRP